MESIDVVATLALYFQSPEYRKLDTPSLDLSFPDPGLRLGTANNDINPFGYGHRRYRQFMRAIFEDSLPYSMLGMHEVSDVRVVEVAIEYAVEPGLALLVASRTGTVLG